MLIENKNAVIYAAGGAVGSAVARAFAREGARVFLTGRNVAKLEALATEIDAAGGLALAAEVDALDEQAVEQHLDGVVERAGRLDISFNAIGIPQQGIQGIPLSDLSVESFALPVATYTRAHFVTARAAARRMIAKRSGVILLHTREGWGRPGRRSRGSPAAFPRSSGHTAFASFACVRRESPKPRPSTSCSRLTARGWA
jgi:NAD(P)-dependent dehydrogenase (short-subunit alcohol dehydrogenase family)